MKRVVLGMMMMKMASLSRLDEFKMAALSHWDELNMFGLHVTSSFSELNNI